MNDNVDVLATNFCFSKEELKQWKEERIKSIQTPELTTADETKDHDTKVCKPLPDLFTPKTTALTTAIKENENLKSKLLYITKENTGLLQEMSKLKQKQMKLGDDLREISAMDELNAKEEDSGYAKLTSTKKRQHEEIERLKMDVQRLRSKCGHISKDTMLCSV